MRIWPRVAVENFGDALALVTLPRGQPRAQVDYLLHYLRKARSSLGVLAAGIHESISLVHANFTI